MDAKRVRRSLHLFVCGSLAGNIFRMLWGGVKGSDLVASLVLAILNAWLLLDE